MLDFYRGKRVFVTGHTGFKGSWLCRILVLAGAEVYGYSLEAPTTPSLFELAGTDGLAGSNIGDVRDYVRLKKAFDEARPEIVFHLAAQPIVRDSYSDPAGTYETNVMGTVNILECVRNSACVKSFLNVTTDKVYENSDIMDHAFREDEKLDGFDPYSNSKSCSELVTHSYKKSFLSNVAVSTARAGNVIGGGDFAHDRIIPDCVRAVCAGRIIEVRNPNSTRPYQHVLEPLFAYLMIARRQYENPEAEGWYNVGPDYSDCVDTARLASLFTGFWGEGAAWKSIAAGGPHEAAFLKLDCSRIREKLGWTPKWNIEKAVEKTVEWYRCWADGGDAVGCMEKQIKEFAGNVEG